MGSIQQSGKVVVLKDGGTRRFRSRQERRAIVEETLKPGASVSVVARAHDVNANQVFTWRRQYRAGRLEIAAASNAVLPVKICDTSPKVGPPILRRRKKASCAGVIDIDLGHARVRIEGAADPDCVKAALERLIR
jgi:transposase